MAGIALCRCGPEPGAEVTAPRRHRDNRTEGPGVSVRVLREGAVDLEKHGMKRGVRSPVGSPGKAAAPGQPGADRTGGRDGTGDHLPAGRSRPASEWTVTPTGAELAEL